MTRREATAAVAVIGFVVAAPVGQAMQKIEYPKTRRVDQVDDYHGTKVEDPYRWLEDDHSEETRAWVEAENRVTFDYLSKLPQREPLRGRLTELWNYPRYGTPFHKKNRYFFFKNDGLQNQSVLYRQESETGNPEVLLDPNLLSEKGTAALSSLAVSEDGSKIVYGIATAGSDWQELRVRDVATGQDLPDRLQWIKFSGAAWTRDGAGFFYCRFPEPKQGEAQGGVNRNQKVFYHRLATIQAEDRLVYERPDEPEWGYDVKVSDDGAYALLQITHGTDERNRVYVLEISNGSSGWSPTRGEAIRLLDGFDASYDFVGNDGSLLYFRTNLDAPRYRLLAIDLRSPDRSQWREIVPESEDVVESVSLIDEKFVLVTMHDAHSRVALYSKDGTFLENLALPTLGSVAALQAEREDKEMFFAFQSFVYPTTIEKHDFRRGETTVVRAPEIAFDGGAFTTEQLFYRSKDGTSIPMFVTHKRGIVLDGSNPTYLYGYGGFNISLTPSFSVSNLVWLELGGVYAQVNLRGGGEYGEKWHESGMLARKQNVFDDFIAAAEFLVAKGYTRPRKLAIGGGSNGGLLIGAVLNQRPDLFGVGLPAVGVMDMLRFQKFTIGWAWTSDYGSSDDPDDFRALYAYSPYHNLKPSPYFPATLVTTADHDDRVVPGHSFKYAARLQEVHGGEPRPMLIRIQTDAGHGGGKPVSMVIEEQADRWAFVMANLGMEWPKTPSPKTSKEGSDTFSVFVASSDSVERRMVKEVRKRIDELGKRFSVSGSEDAADVVVALRRQWKEKREKKAYQSQRPAMGTGSGSYTRLTQIPEVEDVLFLEAEIRIAGGPPLVVTASGRRQKDTAVALAKDLETAAR
jgi:prolyl oligopeptidase